MPVLHREKFDTSQYRSRKLVLATESLFSDILAGDGKIVTLFYSVTASFVCGAGYRLFFKGLSNEIKLAGWNNITGIFYSLSFLSQICFTIYMLDLFGAFSLSCLSFTTGEFFYKLSRDGGEEKLKGDTYCVWQLAVRLKFFFQIFYIRKHIPLVSGYKSPLEP